VSRERKKSLRRRTLPKNPLTKRVHFSIFTIPHVSRNNYLHGKEGIYYGTGLHIGSYDEEAKTLKRMETFLAENNLQNDVNDKRRHHEVYLSNPRKTEPSKLKTILRVPVRKRY
jgi:hypothetical protein